MIGKNKGSNFCIPIQCITGVALSNKTKTKAMYRCILVGLLPLVFMLIQSIKNAHGDNHNKLKLCTVGWWSVRNHKKSSNRLPKALNPNNIKLKPHNFFPVKYSIAPMIRVRINIKKLVKAGVLYKPS